MHAGHIAIRPAAERQLLTRVRYRMSQATASQPLLAEAANGTSRPATPQQHAFVGATNMQSMHQLPPSLPAMYGQPVAVVQIAEGVTQFQGKGCFARKTLTLDEAGGRIDVVSEETCFCCVCPAALGYERIETSGWVEHLTSITVAKEKLTLRSKVLAWVISWAVISVLVFDFVLSSYYWPSTEDLFLAGFFGFVLTCLWMLVLTIILNLCQPMGLFMVGPNDHWIVKNGPEFFVPLGQESAKAAQAKLIHMKQVARA